MPAVEKKRGEARVLKRHPGGALIEIGTDTKAGRVVCRYALDELDASGWDEPARAFLLRRLWSSSSRACGAADYRVLVPDSFDPESPAGQQCDCYDAAGGQACKHALGVAALIRIGRI